MNDLILLELADKWEREAKPPDIQSGNPEDDLSNAMAEGGRLSTRHCAGQLRALVNLLGEG